MKTTVRVMIAVSAIWMYCFALYYPRQPVGFYSDSLHLLRPYSASELRRPWTGNWDPDGVENPGYRPLSALFYDLSFRLIGESAKAYQVFLLSLWCLASFGVIVLLSLFGVPLYVSVATCWIWMTSPFNATHIAWLSDGIHIFQAILIVPAGLLWILSARSTSRIPRHVLYLSGLLLSLSAILTREDSMGMVLVVASLPALDAFMAGAERSRIYRILAKYEAPICMVAVLFFGVRHWALRGVSTPYVFRPLEFVYGVVRLDPNFFTFGRLSSILGFTTASLGVLFLSLLLYTLWREGSAKSVWISTYLAIALAVSSIHLVIIARVNLVIFPSLLVSLCIALGLWRTYKLRRDLFSLAVACFAITAILAIRENRHQQTLFLPYSLETLRYDIGNLYGERAPMGKVTIPIVRRQAVLEKLHSITLDHLPTLRQDFNRLADRCQADPHAMIGPVICMPEIRLPDNFELIPQFKD